MTWLKIILIGFLTTVFRIIGQMLIPARSQDVLLPSVFVENGTLPIVFLAYGTFAYGVIAAMFLLIRYRVPGHRITQGLKYGISCCIVWVVYLLEPLAHAAPIDRITYPIIDGIALLILGALTGALLGTDYKKAKNTSAKRVDYIVIGAITVTFTAGRLLQYLVFGTYSMFIGKIAETLIWVIAAGLVISGVISWLRMYVPKRGRWFNAVVLGTILFGADLALFNFFVPLVLSVDILDLIVRTVIDTAAVTIGCLIIQNEDSAKVAG